MAALLVAERRESQAGKWFTKPVASAAFIAVAVFAGALDSDYGRLILLGLGLCLLGDVLLIPEGRLVVFRAGVFAFLGAHLAGASALLGWRRTAAYTLITWGVAFVAEASSIRTGIPFGWYYYVPATADQELWIAGVPFFDSISFPFLLVSGYGLAWWLLSGRGGAVLRARPGRTRHLLLATTLFVLADVIIDPVRPARSPSPRRPGTPRRRGRAERGHVGK